jgi:asparagine synthase (glutamine-hydrolysing)
MPGITGIISRHPQGNEEEKLRTMLNSMMHESFYTHGTYVNREKGFFIGFSSIEGAFSDCMPIFNEKKDLVLFLTGECYTDVEVIRDLHRRHDFDPGNGSYLIHLYEEQGEEFFRNLNGWYNGVILNLNNGKASLFNDRFGIRRIYYHENDGAFVFSAEAKSLLKAFPSLRKINSKSIGEYLVYDSVLENRTYFSDIFLLPQGSVWNIAQGKADRKRYFDPGVLEDQPVLDEKNYFDELSGTFVKILPRYFSGASVGMSLTGGLDTRMIMACRNPDPGDLPCYTFCGAYRDFLDVRLASRVAQACNQTHTVLPLDEDEYLSEYSSHVERSIYISDGMHSVDKADAICFNKLARQIAPVRMTGKYGSQVLKSVFGFQDRSPHGELIHGDFSHHLSTAKETCSQMKKGNEYSFRLYSEIPWWWNGFIAVESSQVSVRSPFLDNDFIKVLYRAPSRSLDHGAQFQLALITGHNPALMSIPTTGTHGGSRSKIMNQLIKNYFKLLMIAGKVYIRERIPLSMTHWVGRLDYWLAPLHAEKLISGFADFRRYRVWYRDQLAPYLRDTLLCNRTYSRPYWNRTFLEKVIYDHTEGRGTYLREIRKVLQIELIHRVLLEDL